jgi:hypothetical protein
MKRKLSVLLATFLLLSAFLSSCSVSLQEEQEANDYVDATQFVDKGVRATLTGNLLSVGSHSMTVIPSEGSKVAQKGDQVVITVTSSVVVLDENGESISLSDLVEGDFVSIQYDGNILESYPLRISVCYSVQRLAS